MDFIVIRDTITGKRLAIVKEHPWHSAVMIVDDKEPTPIRHQSVGKAIRTWMEERKKDV